MKKHELKILPQYFQAVWSGIKTFEQAIGFVEDGCSRLGTSSGIAILDGYPEK